MKSITIRNIQETQKESYPKKPFNIRKVENLRMGKGLTQPLHRHDFYYLLAIEKGEGLHNIDFQEYGVNNYSIYFMRPGQVHEHDFEIGATGFLIAFQPNFYPYHKDIEQKKSLRKVSQTNCYTFSSDDFNSLKSIFERIYVESEAHKEHFEGVIRSYLSILITSINRIGVSANPVTKYSHFSERLEELQELIEKDIYDSKKVTYYAEKMNLSTYQLNTVTQKLLGKNASELISEHLILEAKRLLLSTTNQVNEIAFQLGFEDPPYFIRFIKKHMQVTPKSFRDGFK